tara:strand:- start:1424 stop:3331 length:1908 start_codon:yes stop_codon:yes gene_type:complete
MAEVTTIQIRGEDRTSAAFRSANKGLNRLERNLQSASAKTASLTAGLGKLGGVMAGLVGVGALGSFTSELLKTGDRLQKVSLQLGLTVDELEILQFAASQSGVETTALNTSLQKLTVNIGKAAEGTKAQKDAFEALGVSVADADGNLSGTSETFVQVAEAIAGIEDPAKKAQIATDLFGRAGVELLPLLNSGAAGISTFAQTIRDAGGIIGQDGADEISNFNDKMDLLQRSLRGKVVPVLVAVLPALTTLAENLDEVAKFAAVVGAGFIAAKIPAAFLAITAAVKGLTLAMAANPLGLIATGLAAIAVYKGDEIAEAFGFAEEAPKELKKTNTKLEETAKDLKAIDKAEKIRIKTSKEFVKTTKGEVVPSLKKLEEGLGETKIKFTSLMGREGLGGVQLAFITFLGNLQTNALDYLNQTQNIVIEFFAFVKQDFKEFFLALDNIVIFEGQKVRDNFSDILKSISKNIKGLNNEIADLDIDVPGSIFTFRNTFVDIPGDIFNLDSSSLVTASNRITDIVSQVDGVKRTVVRTHASRYDTTKLKDKQGRNLYTKKPNEYWEFSGSKLTESGTTVSRTSSAMPSPAASNASTSSGSSSIQINIFDGTGKAISQYDTNLRIEVKDVTSRQGTLPPIRIS